MEKTLIDKVRLIGLSEGVSFLVLLFIAMPLKYIWMYPIAVKVVGMIHGILFMLYLAYIFKGHRTYNWGMKLSTLLFIGSLLPFGTFFTDRKLKDFEEREEAKVTA